MALWKVSEDGNVTMLNEYGVEGGFDIGRQAKVAKDGGYVIVGETEATGVIDLMVRKTDANGVLEWERTYGRPNGFDFGYMIDTTSVDGYFMSGRTCPSFSVRRLWALRINGVGDTIWTKEWGPMLDNGGLFLSTKRNGDPLVCGGWAYAPDQSLMRAYQAELNAEDGSFIWQREYGPVNAGYLFAAKEVGPGQGHIAVGYQTAPPITTMGSLLRTADNGDSLWMRNYLYVDSLLPDGKGVLYDVITTLDGGFAACGTTYGSVSGNVPPGYTQDAWVIKVDSLGCIEPGCNIPLGITTQITNLRDALTVFPNPVPQGGQVTVQVALPEGFRKEPLRLSVVSADGRLVEERELGPHTSQLTLHTSTYASGLYHLHLTSGTTWLSGAKLVVE